MIWARSGFEALVLGLKSAVLAHQWGDASVAKVGGRIFAIFSVEGPTPTISFKCSDMAFELLPEVRGCRPAPYLARAKWIAVTEGGALSAEEVSAYIVEAHRIIAGRLPRALREGLGLSDGAMALPRKSSAPRPSA